ncbi:CAAX protease family protein [Pseudonocardia sulfidoxydans NBRC 16205]|uniref:CAAX protease family protein n=2 Tax=Pseudonocardia sulfidoxydans TaxID=54011 RepID=A0A511DPC8_9PSEU|nr:type II CAAX endopeptidase family protein [Pseudonocardia sulfidoxydans]GEL26655.1 CAAX protease family protein [Pseudonocardia sulfidoxydans NBRC 16205]
MGAPPVGTPEPRQPHRWGFPAYLLVEGVFLGVSALLGWLLVRGSAPGVWTVAVLLGLPTLCAATVAIVITIVRGNGPAIDLGLRFSWRDVGLGVAFGVGGLVLSIPAALIYMAIIGPENASSAVGDVFENLTAGPAQAFLVFALVALVAPFCEEVVYRGLLWGAMEKHGANRWVAFALTTIIFALAHFEFTRTPLLLIVAIPIGLARALTGNLTASIVAHQINNLLPAVALALSLTGALPGAV